MRKGPICALCAALCTLATMLAPSAHAVDVVVSIKPIHALVAGVMKGAGEPRLMVGGAASPHMYQMRPSEAAALSDAELIVWVGKALETFLDRAVANLGAGVEVATLHEAAGVRLLPNREGGIWSGEEPAFHVDEHDDHGHDHGRFDTHVWLDPGNARWIVATVADALARIDPGRAETYRGNAAAMRGRIVALESSLRERLAPLRHRAFIVFHDGYRYFEHAFGLNSIGAVAVDPARPPGAKRLADLRGALVEHDVRCVFAEPQFEPDLVRTVVEGTGIRTATLDPLGAGVEPGADAWFEIMRNLGASVAECLGGG